MLCRLLPEGVVTTRVLLVVFDGDGVLACVDAPVPPVNWFGGFVTRLLPEGVVTTRVLLVVLVDDGVLAASARGVTAGVVDGGVVTRRRGPSLT